MRRSAAALSTALCCASLSLGAPLRAQVVAPDTTPTSTRPFFTSADAITLGAFAAATAAVIPADRYFAARLRSPRVQSSTFVRRSAAVVRDAATPGSLIIGGTLYAVGRIGGNQRMASLGLHGTEAVLIGLGTVGVGKVITGRARPYVVADTNPRDFKFLRGLRGGSDYQSFPSGHSVMAFAAAVGTFVGQKVVRYHRTHPRNRVDRWLLAGSLVPAAGGGRLVRFALVPQ